MPLPILLAGQAMAVMDGSILVVASPSLRVDLHASAAELQLVVAIYTLALAALVVTGARLGDVLGRARAFLLGVAGFALASLLGGLAPSAPALIGARALQGAAGALMTPQVLSIIQSDYHGERRARAIGAYSMILAAGVAAGQVAGGLLVGAHLLPAAWRPALLINAPVGGALLITGRRALRAAGPPGRVWIDAGGIVLLAGTLLALVAPLTLGRDERWPDWVWLSLGASVAGAAWFARHARAVTAAGRRALLDVRLLAVPGVATGALAVVLVMAAYAGFLLSVTLRLQGPLGYTPLHAGLVFAVYALGFAVASLSWTRLGPRVRASLPVTGQIAMGAALLAVGLVARGGGWPEGVMAPLMLAGGAGHALGFAPLTARLTTVVADDRAADLSGLILTASLIGQVLGVAGIAGAYLSAGASAGGGALTLAAEVIAATLIVGAGCALSSGRAARAARGRRRPSARAAA